MSTGSIQMLESSSTVSPAKGGETMPEWNEQEHVSRAREGDIEPIRAAVEAMTPGDA